MSEREIARLALPGYEQERESRLARLKASNPTPPVDCFDYLYGVCVSVRRTDLGIKGGQYLLATVLVQDGGCMHCHRTILLVLDLRRRVVVARSEDEGPPSRFGFRFSHRGKRRRCTVYYQISDMYAGGCEVVRETRGTVRQANASVEVTFAEPVDIRAVNCK